MDFNRITRTTAPVNKPLTLTEVKRHLNISHSDEDSYLNSLIDTATAMVDGPSGLGIAMISQQYIAVADNLDTVFTIPLTPVQSVESIQYLTTEGSQTVESSTYRVETDTRPAIVVLDNKPSGVLVASAKVQFTAGYGDNASDVPQDIRHALLMVVATLYDAREGMAPTSLAELPFGVRSIFNRYGVPA